MTPYRCKGKDCGFSTEDLEEFVRHVVGHQEEASPPKRTHSSAREYLECPECSPAFEKELLARGWRKPEEKKKRRQSIL